MNTARNAFLLASASLLLAACASTPETASQPGSSASQDVDLVYVEAVNRASRQAGVRVVWINPPRPGDRTD